NVIAGPAGFFPVTEPSKHGTCTARNPKTGACTACTPPAGYPNGSCEYSWVDPVTTPRGALNIPKYDLFFALQDRDFNADGSLNFPNGMASVPGASGYAVVPGNTSFVPGPNPQVHPVWVPEYFASNALVNGVIWPKKTVEAGYYRVRLVDGSDARCYTLAFNLTDPWATGALVRPNPATDRPFTVIANEQGYLPGPVTTTSFTMCPGERYEFIFNFAGLAGQSVYMINEAPAPFPGGGNGPFDPQSPYEDMATIMRFDVVPAVAGSTVTNLVIPKVLDPDFVDVTNLPMCASRAPADSVGKLCIAAVRNLYLAEKIDGTTGASLGLQINGVPFEYDVTETPVKGTYEKWNIVNLTVDAHPMHPHLGRFQIVQRQDFDVAGYKLALCQSNTAPIGPYPGPGPTWADNFADPDNNCTPSMAPGGVLQLTPDPAGTLPGTPNFLLGKPSRPPPSEAGWKDAMRAMPGQVLTFVGKWDGSWAAAATLAQVTAPGAGNVSGRVGGNAASWLFPDVTTGPYVWHCHINSHEDSEMMRTSLVVKP
ncbi:MAG TPA: multicopper oxidase domain-containing protein, partial [Anaeromyxobacteraceae bacterium]|nr:multicopper oxidase domain-containing protein [Anaeromyxobacteraceae bacterium]